MIKGPGESTIVEGNFKRSFGLVPQVIATQPVLRPCRQLHLKGEVENGVYVLQKVENVRNLTRNLLRCAENVSVILLESPDTD